VNPNRRDYYAINEQFDASRSALLGSIGVARWSGDLLKVAESLCAGSANVLG
jgi:hypothetical protein